MYKEYTKLKFEDMLKKMAWENVTYYTALRIFKAYHSKKNKNKLDIDLLVDASVDAYVAYLEKIGGIKIHTETMAVI